MFRFWHGYCWLLSARLTMSIRTENHVIQKRIICSTGAKTWMLHWISIKKSTSALYPDNRKGGMKTSQSLVRTHLAQSHGYKWLNIYEWLCFEKSFRGALLLQDHKGNFPPKIIHLGTQSSLQPQLKDTYLLLKWTTAPCRKALAFPALQNARGFHKDIREILSGQAMSPWGSNGWSLESKVKGAVGTPGIWSCQEQTVC